MIGIPEIVKLINWPTTATGKFRELAKNLNFSCFQQWQQIWK